MAVLQKFELSKFFLVTVLLLLLMMVVYCR